MNIKLPCPIGGTIIPEDGEKFLVCGYEIQSQTDHLLFAIYYDEFGEEKFLVGRNGELVSGYTVKE